MLRLYCMRHAESEANVLKVFSNRDPSVHPLTERGVSQAEAAAKRLAAIPFDRIYTSDLLRARQTAAIIAARCGVEVIPSTRLREHDAGVLEGRSDPVAWAEYNALVRSWFVYHRIDERIEGGESLNDLRRRLFTFIEALRISYAGHMANVLLVGHGGLFMSGLPLLLENLSYEYVTAHLLRYCDVAVAEWRGSGWTCIEWAGRRPQ